MRGRLTSPLIEGRKPYRHSQKPAIYEAIESISAGPYLELFARLHSDPRPGRAYWGTDVADKRANSTRD
jgi:hypothetical protein